MVGPECARCIAIGFFPHKFDWLLQDGVAITYKAQDEGDAGWVTLFPWGSLETLDMGFTELKLSRASGRWTSFGVDCGIIELHLEMCARLKNRSRGSGMPCARPWSAWQCKGLT